MTELFFAFDKTRGIFDIDPAVVAPDVDAALFSAVIVSLFTDARALPEDRLPDEPRQDGIADPGLPLPADRDLRGWWGGKIGSRGWLLSSEKQIESVRQRIEDYDREALAWMIKDKVASAVTVRASFPERGVVVREVTIERPGRPAMTYRFERAWRGIEQIGEARYAY